MIGIYRGYYRYSSKKVQKAIGFEKTDFIIKVTFFDGETFSGTVKDDVETGGMKEEGFLKGKIIKNQISFEKYMPKHYELNIFTNGHKIKDDIHPTIFYSGSALDENCFSGQWKIRRNYKFLLGLFSVALNLGTGTWRMEKEN